MKLHQGTVQQYSILLEVLENLFEDGQLILDVWSHGWRSLSLVLTKLKSLDLTTMVG